MLRQLNAFFPLSTRLVTVVVWKISINSEIDARHESHGSVKYRNMVLGYLKFSTPLKRRCQVDDVSIFAIFFTRKRNWL